MVPFGRGRRCGVVMAVTAVASIEQGRLKRAERLLDTEPLLAREDLALLNWAAGYYQHPIGEVVATALPVRLRKGEPVLSPRLPGWRLTQTGEGQDPGQLIRAPRQAAVLSVLSGKPAGMAQSEIYDRCDECRTVLKNMQEKGWIEACEVSREVDRESPVQNVNPRQLNSEQQVAVDAVMAGLGIFSAFLLDGVTGSGKTEVYLSLTESVTATGGQVLVLVPEIGLTPQLLRRFRQRLDQPVEVMHSALSDSERELAWHRIRSGEARVLLGTRSALFTPMPQLGLIIVDEEHDMSLKQQEGFRYSARDSAVLRAKRQDCPVVLGSATPSLESIHNARNGRYQWLKLTRRATGAESPRIDLIDIRSVRLDAGVSPTMMRLVAEQLDQGNQVLLFLNRRGYAPVVICHDCGWTSECRRCDARMTLHQQSGLLWCHHCGSQRRLDSCCPECGGVDLRPLGQGTERLEQMLQQRFAGVSLVRIDRDSTRRKGSLEQLLGEIREGKHSLLLGTQMLAKGHHFPDVTLVGILDVDQGLFGSDFRASERMAQLIVQVAGRAGREEKPGRVILQTHHPEHPLLQTLVNRGYDAFAEEALAERQETAFPPFTSQVLLRAEAADAKAPRQFLEQALELVQGGGDSIECWGPVPAPMERRAGRYRAHLLLQSSERGRLRSFVSTWMPQLQGLKSGRKVRWSIDVDPQEML
jgi:primosomal protein N' (replication factor Y)